MTDYEPAGINPMLRNWAIVVGASIAVVRLFGGTWGQGVVLGFGVIAALHILVLAFVFFAVLLAQLTKGGK